MAVEITNQKAELLKFTLAQQKRLVEVLAQNKYDPIEALILEAKHAPDDEKGQKYRTAVAKFLVPYLYRTLPPIRDEETAAEGQAAEGAANTLLLKLQA